MLDAVAILYHFLSEKFQSGFDYRRIDFNEPNKFPGQKLNTWRCLAIHIKRIKPYEKLQNGKVDYPDDEFVLMR